MIALTGIIISMIGVALVIIRHTLKRRSTKPVGDYIVLREEIPHVCPPRPPVTRHECGAIILMECGHAYELRTDFDSWDNRRWSRHPLFDDV